MSVFRPILTKCKAKRGDEGVGSLALPAGQLHVLKSETHKHNAKLIHFIWASCNDFHGFGQMRV